MIEAIAAVDENYGIGFKGELLESIPDDLKHFKELTSGNVVIMGKNTWDSLPIKPLPGRVNFVITREPKEISPAATFFMTLEQAKQWLESVTEMNNKDFYTPIKIFIIGGGFIYKELLPYCDKIHLTKIYKKYEQVDTYFPIIDEIREWKITDIGPLQSYNKTINDKSKNVFYRFLTYEKI